MEDLFFTNSAAGDGTGSCTVAVMVDLGENTLDIVLCCPGDVVGIGDSAKLYARIRTQNKRRWCGHRFR